MSIVVIPGQFRGDQHPVGKLASTLMSVLVAGMADPARFRRGKVYVGDGAVSRLEVSHGQLLAKVVGSRDEPYQVVVTTRTIDRPVLGSPEVLRNQINRLTPEGGDLMVSCSCPDWDDPCKHAVAALLAFSNELVSRPELLIEWRCTPSAEPSGGRAQVGSRAKPGERHLRLAPEPVAGAGAGAGSAVAGAGAGSAGGRAAGGADGSTRSAGEAPTVTRTRPPEPPSPWEDPEWVEFLGQPPQVDLPDVPAQPVAVRRAMLGTIDLGAWVQSALEELSGLHP